LSGKQTNWAGNYVYSAERWHFPETVAQVQDVVVSCTKLRAVGTRHSFNGIADSTHDMVSLERCDRVLTLDRAQRTVTVEAGIRYGQLARHLHAEGYALHNLASLPHISLAGACATATHGSGVGNGNLATAVTAMEIVTANGQRIELSRAKDGERFLGAVVGLGGLGVVTKLTLDIVPTFSLRQDVYENLPMAQLEDHFDEILASAYSVSLFTDWRSERFNQWWLKSIVPESETLPGVPEGRVSPAASERYGATRATAPRHPLAGLSAESCTEQGGVPGPWHERLPHFRIDFTPSAGEELQSEYFVPHRLGCEALRALAGLRERIAPLLQVSEIRTVAADDLWMSPCYRQASVALHFTWLKDWPEVKALLPQIEEALAPFDARPHWGKLYTMPPDRLQALYPKLPEFRRLLHAFDPDGKFRNSYLEMLY
jgi:xylitol oxidase